MATEFFRTVDRIDMVGYLKSCILDYHGLGNRLGPSGWVVIRGFISGVHVCIWETISL